MPDQKLSLIREFKIHYLVVFVITLVGVIISFLLGFWKGASLIIIFIGILGFFTISYLIVAIYTLSKALRNKEYEQYRERYKQHIELKKRFEETK
jgi:flagellar motor component MotA